MVRKVLAGAAGAALLLVIVIASRPNQFHVERSIIVDAPPESVFAHVNDFHAWQSWSPYEKLDPKLERTFAGPASGFGAVYAWAGDDKVGAGKMTIEKSEVPSTIAIKLEFSRPMASEARATFTFANVPGGTKATWAMDGNHNFVAKAFAMVVEMDKFLGKQFEDGLGALKTVSERTKDDARTANAGN